MKKTHRSRWPLCAVLATGLLLGACPAGAAEPAASPAQKATLEEARALLSRADALHTQKNDAEAIPLLEKALALREKALGPDHRDVLSVTRFLGDCLMSKGEYARAVAVRERVLAMVEKKQKDGEEQARTQKDGDPQGKRHRDGDARVVAQALEELALACLRAGDTARAVALYDRTLTLREKLLGPEHLDVGLSMMSLGRALIANNELDRAESTLARALAFFEASARSEAQAVIANVLALLGATYRARGEYAKAVTTLERALGIQARVWGADHGFVADALVDLGRAYTQAGDYASAEKAFERAIRIDEKLGPESLSLASTLGNLALVYDEKGDYARSEPMHRRALAILEKMLPAGHRDIAWSQIALGRCYMLKGSLAQAEPRLMAGFEGWEKAVGPEHRDTALALGVLGEFHRRKGELDRAERLAARALAIREKTLRPDHPEIASARTALARIHESRGDVAGAERLYALSLATREKQLGPAHPTVGTSLYDLAELHRRKGSAAKAEPLYRRALAIFERSLGPDDLHVAESLEGLAALDVATGKVDAALAGQARANDIYEHNVGLVLAGGSEAQKRDFLTTLASSTDFTVALHAQVAPTNTAAARLALTTVLQRKGRILDVMADTLASLRKRLTPADRALFEDLAATRARIATMVLQGAGEMPADAFRKDLAGLEEKAQKLEATMGERSSAFRSFEAPATIERVQAAMPEDAALVELFIYRPWLPADPASAPRWGAPRYVAYTLAASGKMSAVDLGEAAPIDQVARRLRKALASYDSQDAKTLARELDTRVMQPVRPLLGGATRLLLSPDGALNTVPFAALVDEGGRYLVERFELTYLTSGRDLLRLQFHAAARSGALVVANPAFGRAAPLSAGSGAAGEAGRGGPLKGAIFEPLPGTAGEGRALAKLLPGAKLRVDTEATEASLKEAQAPRILHIATHGFFLGNQVLTPSHGARGLALDHGQAVTVSAPAAAPPSQVTGFENPLLRSGLALAGANAPRSGAEDGILTALEAAGLDLHGTELVVLSACETGLGDVQNGDGVYGLRRAFVIAGAETLVASLWKVDDAETRDLMVSYYGKLEKGGGRSASLREVQLAMLARPATAHPYFWASFLVSGDPSPLGAGAAASPGAGRASATAATPPGKLDPGARGCACEIGAPSDGGRPAGLVLIAAAWAVARRLRARGGAIFSRNP